MVNIKLKIYNGKSTEAEILSVLNKYGINKIADQDLMIEVWGSGRPMREFLWSEDMADATIHVMESVNFLELIDVSIEKDIRNTHINVGTGSDISIKELALLVKKIIGFKGQLWFNTEKPDGTLKKLTDVSKLHSLGWKHKVDIEEGVSSIYNWYKKY